MNTKLQNNILSQKFKEKFVESLQTDQELISQIYDLLQNCSISSANALVILQSCTKPSKWFVG